MVGDWLSLHLDEALPTVRAAEIVQPKAGSHPSDVDREADLTTEVVPIPKEFSPDAVFGYRSEARRGDPRNLFALYDEMPGRAAGPQIRRSREAIESAEFEFAPMPLAARDETIRTPEARMGREVAGYIDEQLRPFMRAALGTYARREQYGLGAAAFRVEPGMGPGGLERAVAFDEIPGRRFRLDYRTFEWGFFPRARGGSAVPVQPFRDTGSLLLFEDGAGRVPLDQRGLLWQVLIAWCIYQFGLRWWARANERFAMPYLDIGYGANVTNGAAEGEKIARKLGSSGAAVHPIDGIELKFLQGLSTSSADSLERNLDHCIRHFDAVILGHAQASGAREGAGARSSDVFAKDVSAELVEQQLGRASVDLTEQWVRPMVLRNLGERAAKLHTPALLIRSKTRVDREAEARIANLAVSAGAEIPQSEFLKRIGYREARPDERVMTRRTAPAPAAAQPAGNLGENVVRFPLLSDGKPPVLGADGAPAGIGEEILAPYRRIFLDAQAEGATPVQALARVAQRARTRPEGKLLADRISSVLFASTGHGIESVRDERSGK